jgi:phosphatidate cytidylyltransferase
VISIRNRDASAETGGPRLSAGTRNLLLRLTSAVVLAPIVLAAAYLGGWPFLILCAAGAGGILWEWTHLVSGRSDPRILAPGGVALAAAVALVGGNALGTAVGAAAGAIGVGAVLAGVTAVAGTAENAQRRGAWAAGGVIYAGVAFLGPALLRRDTELGFEAFLFLAATVWLTDILAYSVGRVIGGPALWPRVSPNKTWAGAIGGLAGGVAGGTIVAYAGGMGCLAVVGVIALLLSALAQTGDLIESAIKRHFGAKDTSQLIPGHGGLMDRLDGFLVAALAGLVIGILHQGTYAPAHGLLVW